MRLIVTGASGLLGAHISQAALARGWHLTALSRRRPTVFPGADSRLLDLTEPRAAARLAELSPDWIVHCAALTDVDRCQREFDLAQRVNAWLPGRLAKIAGAVRARLLYVSTDAVFDGQPGPSPLAETDIPAPVNVYGATKLEGERAVALRGAEHLVARVNFYGSSIQGNHGLADWILGRIEKGLTVPAFTDVIFTPLAAPDLADILLDLLEGGAGGLFHVFGAQPLSKYDFALALARSFGHNPDLVVASTIEGSSLRAPRPRCLPMSSAKAEWFLRRPMPNLVQGLTRLRQHRETGYFEKLKAIRV